MDIELSYNVNNFRFSFSNVSKGTNFSETVYNASDKVGGRNLIGITNNFRLACIYNIFCDSSITCNFCAY